VSIHAGSNAQHIPQHILERLDVRLLEPSAGDAGWDTFSLDYKLTAPLDIVVTASSMQQYLRIFNFLWRLKRVDYTLSSTWQRCTSNHTLHYTAALHSLSTTLLHSTHAPLHSPFTLHYTPALHSLSLHSPLHSRTPLTLPSLSTHSCTPLTLPSLATTLLHSTHSPFTLHYTPALHSLPLHSPLHSCTPLTLPSLSTTLLHSTHSPLTFHNTPALHSLSPHSPLSAAKACHCSPSAPRHLRRVDSTARMPSPTQPYDAFRLDAAQLHHVRGGLSTPPNYATCT
jgi:hypothetical protein